MEAISVLLVDDHPVVRQGLRSMLETDAHLKIVGEAENGEDALVKVEQHSPEVVLIDIHMPVMDGLTATRRIKEKYPRTSVIVLTLYNNEQYVIEAVKAGAAGYLLKNSSRDEISKTIREVNNGGLLIKTTMLQKALAGAIEGGGAGNLDFRGKPWGTDADFEALSARELEVLKLLVEGMTNKDIGAQLFITEDTAKKHVQNIIYKLQVSDRTQAAVKAIRMGLVR
ncbi:MAG TPA: response regulator transcription factor [Chloroflexota bacterium]|nr:response regulator transcription factor [Chloroflexota bacterium]